MSDDNESQPQDAEHQDRSVAEAVSAELASSSKDSQAPHPKDAAMANPVSETHAVRHLTCL